MARYAAARESGGPSGLSHHALELRSRVRAEPPGHDVFLLGSGDDAAMRKVPFGGPDQRQSFTSVDGDLLVKEFGAAAFFDVDTS